MTRVNWQDEIVEKPRTFNKIENLDGTITLEPAKGEIYQEGTPVNAANLNALGAEFDVHQAKNVTQAHEPFFEKYREKIATLNGTSPTINLSDGNVFVHTLTGNSTYTITNAVNGQAHSFTLIINMGSTVITLTFPASVKWQGGEIPDMSTANKSYVLTFMSVNGGGSWLGMFGGEF